MNRFCRPESPVLLLRRISHRQQGQRPPRSPTINLFQTHTSPTPPSYQRSGMCSAYRNIGSMIHLHARTAHLHAGRQVGHTSRIQKEVAGSEYRDSHPLRRGIDRNHTSSTHHYEYSLTALCSKCRTQQRPWARTRTRSVFVMLLFDLPFYDLRRLRFRSLRGSGDVLTSFLMRSLNVVAFDDDGDEP